MMRNLITTSRPLVVSARTHASVRLTTSITRTFSGITTSSLAQVAIRPTVEKLAAAADLTKNDTRSIPDDVKTAKYYARTTTKKDVQKFDDSVLSRFTPTLLNFTLDGKVAIVTGGGRGLGRCMAEGLIEAGLSALAIFDANRDTGPATAEQLSRLTKIPVDFHFVDVRDDSECKEAVAAVVAKYGQVDVLVNSAGIAPSNIPSYVCDSSLFKRVQDVNLIGTFNINQAVANAMRSNGNGGSIINIASMSATIVNYPQEQSAYNASKAGVVHLTHSLASEWADAGIRVNAISPGYMDTDLNRVPTLDAQKKIWIERTPQKRLGHASELNNLAVYLASDGSKFMTGSNLIIDGGYTLW